MRDFMRDYARGGRFMRDFMRTVMLDYARGGAVYARVYARVSARVSAAPVLIGGGS